MQLNDLLTDIPLQQIVGNSDLEICGLDCDSRCVSVGSLFFALPGEKVDGFAFIPQAIEQGAVAVVISRMPETVDHAVCYIQVENVRQVMARMAAKYNDLPTDGVPVIGVTGTNGKTTITYLLEAVLKQAGYSPAVFGTVECRFGEQRIESTHTTPESVELMRMMGGFRKQGADAFILEVSSHALEQHRVDGISFDVAIFTNLTPEHLDYHENLHNYFVSKRRLFSDLLGDGFAAINIDDGFGRQLLKENSAWVGFGFDGAAQVRPDNITISRDGIHGSFDTNDGPVRIDSSLIGNFNVSNLLATVTAAQQLGIKKQTIAAGLANALQVPGRLQRIDNDNDVLVLVDYAHTSDALEQVLNTLEKLEHRRLITLVGCGGDRDPAKRPVMASTAVRYSDLAVFTSDNPRTEDPLLILEQMRAGTQADGAVELSKEQIAAGERGFIVVPDRRQAIDLVSEYAKAGDLLLVAGKGHEDYQILGTTKIHFDDREELERAFAVRTGARVNSDA